MARMLAGASLGVLAIAAVLFGTAWAIGGEESVSDNWVGFLTMIGLFAGLLGTLAALVTGLFAGRRGEPWARLWLPLAAFPGVLLAVVLLEAFVLE